MTKSITTKKIAARTFLGVLASGSIYLLGYCLWSAAWHLYYDVSSIDNFSLWHMSGFIGIAMLTIVSLFAGGALYIGFFEFFDIILAKIQTDIRVVWSAAWDDEDNTGPTQF